MPQLSVMSWRPKTQAHVTKPIELTALRKNRYRPTTPLRYYHPRWASWTKRSLSHLPNFRVRCLRACVVVQSPWRNISLPPKVRSSECQPLDSRRKSIKSSSRYSWGQACTGQWRIRKGHMHRAPLVLGAPFLAVILSEISNCRMHISQQSQSKESESAWKSKNQVTI